MTKLLSIASSQCPGGDINERVRYRQSDRVAAVQSAVRAGSVSDLEALDEWRVSFLGRRGELTQLLRGIGSLPPEDRPAAGAAANALRQTLQDAMASAEDSDEAGGVGAVRGADRRHPPRLARAARRHTSTTRIVREICAAFASMGFSVVEGPEIEWDHYNFEMLNIPKGHPARDMWDTLWIDYEDDNGERPMLLRTHTSPCRRGSWRAPARRCA